MNISFLYNWPPAKYSVRVSMRQETVEDTEHLFRIGVVPGFDMTKVFWQGETEWMSSEVVEKISFDVNRGDIVVVDKQNMVTKEIFSRHKWNTEEDWPLEAHGGSTTHVPFIF